MYASLCLRHVVGDLVLCSEAGLGLLHRARQSGLSLLLCGKRVNVCLEWVFGQTAYVCLMSSYHQGLFEGSTGGHVSPNPSR